MWWERYERLRLGEWDATDAAYDGAAPVRRLAASMPLPARTADRLTRDPDARVRVMAAARDDLTVGQLERLARDADGRVRAAVAARDDLTDRLGRILADDTDPRVLDALGLDEAARIVRRMGEP